MFDMIDDRGALLKSFYPNVEDLPEFVRTGLGGFSHGQKLASDEYAVNIPTQGGMMGKYPICNDAWTAVSCLYFDHTHQNLPPELQKQAAVNLLGACQRFDLEPTAKVAEGATAYQEVQTPANTIRKPFQTQGIAGSQMFPLSTPEQVKTASDLFDKILSKLAPDQRREFSQNLLQKSAEFKIQAPKQATRWGGTAMSKLAVMDALEKRTQFMSEGQVQLLRKSADRILEMHPDKVAEFLTDMDTELGIDVLWGRKIPDPRDIYESPKTQPYVKVANIEIPAEWWQDACDKGILSALDPNVQSVLRRDPAMLSGYEGHPVYDHVMGGLETLGMVSKA